MSNFAKKVLSDLPAGRMNQLRIQPSTVNSVLGLGSEITGSIKELFYDCAQKSVTISGPRVTQTGAKYTKYCIRFIDVVYKRRIESDDSTIHTGTSKPDAF